MPTIMDVARRAGVSRSTVSLVLNKSPLVKAATREQVERVIAELNYVPNSNARGLSARTTGNLGVVFMQDFIPSDERVSYDNDRHVGMCSFNISNGIIAGLADTDYGVITERFCSVADPEGMPRVLREKRVDGVFIVGLPYSERFIENLKRAGVPFVMVGVGSYEPETDSVYADPRDGTAMAVRELIETGHERICLLNCSRNLISHEWRQDAWQSALQSAGLMFDPAWNITPEGNDGSGAYEAFKTFWEAGNRPDAIVTANGQAASGAMAYLYGQGVRIPEDISVIAYEDSSLCGYAAPALTAVNIQKENMGALAAERLIGRIRNPEKPVEITALEPYLVRRNSVKNRKTGMEAEK